MFTNWETYFGMANRVRYQSTIPDPVILTSLLMYNLLTRLLIRFVEFNSAKLRFKNNLEIFIPRSKQWTLVSENKLKYKLFQLKFVKNKNYKTHFETVKLVISLLLFKSRIFVKSTLSFKFVCLSNEEQKVKHWNMFFLQRY